MNNGDINHLRNITKEDLENICKESFSYASVLKELGYQTRCGGNYETLKKKIKDFNIDISHFTGKLWSKGKNSRTDTRIKGKPKYTKDEDILYKGSNVYQKQLRNYIKRNNKLEYKCKMCGCDGTWLEGKISLELDHINGDRYDNRLENLRYLCPNCHALTSTYRGKNKKK